VYKLKLKLTIYGISTVVTQWMVLTTSTNPIIEYEASIGLLPVGAFFIGGQ